MAIDTFQDQFKSSVSSYLEQFYSKDGDSNDDGDDV